MDIDIEAVSEIIRLRHSIAAIRTYTLTNLDAIDAQLENLLPADLETPQDNYDLKAAQRRILKICKKPKARDRIRRPGPGGRRVHTPAS